MDRLKKFEDEIRARSGGRKRADLEQQIWPAFVAIYGELPDGKHPRPFLREALEELREGGSLEFPKNRRLFDESASPSLPCWVELREEETGGEAGCDHQRFPWHPRLAWIAGLAQVRRIDQLLAIDKFLKGAGRCAPIVPHRERSLQIFGDEKALDGMLGGNVFAEGRLSLELLRCRRVTPPFVHTGHEAPISSIAPDILIIENHNTWHSFSEWNKSARRFRAVVYGGGMLFEASVEGIEDLASSLGAERLYYFGDLDAEGLAIAFRSDRRQQLRGKPPITPAATLYAALLRLGEGREHPSVGRDKLYELHLAWLPESLRTPVRELFGKRLRLPQEYVGTEWLQLHGDSV